MVRVVVVVVGGGRLYILSSGEWGKIKLKLTTLNHVFHTRRASIELNGIRNPALAGVSFGSRYSDSASCPYRRIQLNVKGTERRGP